MRNLKDTVSHSAGLLDTIRPEWHNDIHVGSLQMSNGIRCIIGQLYGPYILNVQHVISRMVKHDSEFPITEIDGNSERASEYYGFTLLLDDIDHETESPSAYWAELTEAWATEIIRRREAEEE